MTGQVKERAILRPGRFVVLALNNASFDASGGACFATWLIETKVECNRRAQSTPTLGRLITLVEQKEH